MAHARLVALVQHAQQERPHARVLQELATVDKEDEPRQRRQDGVARQIAFFAAHVHERDEQRGHTAATAQPRHAAVAVGDRFERL